MTDSGPGDEVLSAFEVLGNETRLGALWAVWDAEAGVVSFSEIQDAVSVRDSGNLAYHLDRLTGRFLERDEAGYSLLPAGYYVVSIVTTGYLESAPVVSATAFGDSCPACGGELVFSYEETYAAVSCGACERIFTRRPMPPVAIESRSVAEAVAALNAELRSDYRRYWRDVCSFCQARVDPSVVSASEASLLEAMDASDGPFVRFECRNCEAVGEAPAGVLLFWVSEAAEFFARRGVDLQSATIWDAAAWSRAGGAWWEAERETLHIEVERDDASLHVEFDADLEVVSVTRSTGAR